MAEPPSLFGTPREWAQDLGLATLIGLFLGVIGPFGSFYGGPIELRVAYWIANIWIGFSVLSVVVRLSIRAALRFDAPIWFALAAGTVLGCFPLGFVIALFSAWFWPGNHGRVSNFGVWYGQTLAISEPCAFAYYWLGARKGTNPPLAGSAAPCETAAAAATPSPPAPQAASLAAPFLDRLPPRLGRDLLALQMEDHYVRAHTRRGSDLILTPLKEAIAELGGIEGMQVHRSFWVARRAVTGHATRGRNLSLTLSNGMSAPVSRASVAKLKAAGWLEGPQTPGSAEFRESEGSQKVNGGA
jgi:hypothetical protein